MNGQTYFFGGRGNEEETTLSGDLANLIRTECFLKYHNHFIGAKTCGYWYLSCRYILGRRVSPKGVARGACPIVFKGTSNLKFFLNYCF